MRKYLNVKIYCPTLTSLKEENEEQKKEIDYKPTKKEASFQLFCFCPDLIPPKHTTKKKKKKKKKLLFF